MYQRLSFMLCLVLSATLFGCGGGSNSSTNPVPPTPSVETKTGVLLDSAVAGIGYRTETLEGLTNTDGEFEYLSGELVIFFIGNLEFPPVPAKGMVTPLDMAASGTLDDRIVINIARLLQSLDVDGDPSNGITIGDEARANATVLNFDVSTEAFETNPAVINLLANSGSTNTTLVSAETALNHLQGTIAAVTSSLIGSWYYQDIQSSDPANQYHIVLTFLDGNTFVIANDEIDDEAGTDGFELGSYTWNITSLIFSPTVRVDTNGEWGFSHPCNPSESITLELRGGSLWIGAEGGVGEGCDEVSGNAVIELKRITSNSNPLVGSWLASNDLTASDDFALVTFMDGNNYMMVQNSPADESGQPGIERGTYQHDGITNHVVFSTITDTNGQWGFSHPCAVLDVQGINNLACGPGGRDIIETLEIVGNSLIFISEADTIDLGEVDPVELIRVQ